MSEQTQTPNPESVNETEPTNPPLTFERAIQELEDSVKKLESGELSLTASIEKYRQAMVLVQYCRQQLDQAELQIEQLLEGSDKDEASSGAK